MKAKNMDVNFKQKLKSKTFSIGSWLMIGDEIVTEIMTDSGFDWLIIDLEHAMTDLKKTQQLISMVQSKNIECLVRVSKNEEIIIKKVLDAGANGIMVPMICSAADAQQAVDYAYYPPKGKRGAGLYRAQGYGVKFKEYRDEMVDKITIIAQIEHIDAINNLEEIIKTPGIDGVAIGPYDLSASLGTPGDFENQSVKSALDRFKKTCEKLNAPMGFHVIEPKATALKNKKLEGYNFIIFSIDSMFLGEKIREEMSVYQSLQTMQRRSRG